MQEHLPLIRQLCIARLGVADGRGEVYCSWVERRIEGAIHWAGDRHVRRRIVYCHDQRRLRGQLTAVGHRQRHNILCWHAWRRREGVCGVGLRAHRRTIAKVPRVGDLLVIRIVGTVAAQLDRQRRGAIISIRGGNCGRRPITGIGKLLEGPPGVVVSDVIEGAVDRMLDHVDNGAGSSCKIIQCNRLVIGVKAKGVDQSLAPVGKII